MKTKLDHGFALHAAKRLRDVLLPHAEQIEIVGSLRRESPTVGDVELLIQPKHALSLIGEKGERPIDAALAEIVCSGSLVPVMGAKAGALSSRYEIAIRTGDRIQVDLYFAAADAWGVQMAIRTGPAAFSKAAVTNVHRGGLLRDGYSIQGGFRLWYSSGPGKIHQVDVLTEADFFRYLSCGWIEPQDRGRIR